MEISEELRRAYRLNVMLGIVIFAALLIYVIIVEFIKASFKPFTGLVQVSNILIIRYLFYGIAILLIILLRLLRQALLHKKSVDAPRALVQRLSQTSILTLAICEVPALLGLLLFLLAGLSRDFYFLNIIAAILVFMNFPRLKQWEEWIRISI